VHHVDQQIGVQIERRIDVRRVRFAGVDREGDAALAGDGTLVGEVVVVGAAGAVPVGDVEYRGVAAAEDERIDLGRFGSLPERAGSLRARLAEVQTGDRPGLAHELERPAHRLD
jgi:hypothetical protein